MADLKDKVLASLDEKELVELAKMMIETPSVTGDETELAKRLAKFLKGRGFEVELQEVAKGEFQTIGRVRGTGGGKSIMLCGHLDIFPPPLTMKDPYKAVVKGDRIYGAGIGDMKAGDVAIVMAADAVIRSGVKLKGNIIVALVREEEIGGVGIVHLLKSGVTADMGVVTETRNLEISTMGAGVAQFQVSTIGKSTHVSSKEAGVDAIAKMCKVVDAVNKMEFTHVPDPRVPKLPRISAGTIIGGRGKDYDLRGAQNLSDYCTLLVDVRFWKSMSVGSIEKDLRRVLDGIAANDPEFKYELVGVPSPWKNRAINRNPMDVPIDSAIVGIIMKNHQIVTGQQAKIRDGKDTTGNNDSVHMNEAGIPTITYGPGPGKTDMKVYSNLPLAERYIDINTIKTCAKVLALTAVDVCSIKKGKN